VEADLVSTIIPVFNRAELLGEAVGSVLAQTYRPIEIIIVDDGSTDATPAAAAELAERHAEVRLIRRPNGGPGAARESGRLAARGEFIQYLDSDDLLLPAKFELQVAALRAHAEAGAAYGITRYRDREGREILCDWKAANQVVQTIFPSFLKARWWETVSPLFRRSVTDAAGAWTTLRLEEDWEYDARIGALGIKLVFIDAVVAEHRDQSAERLSRGSAHDPARLADRARAHELIADHARRAGVPPAAPEFQHFSRDLFHLARQCAAAGLVEEARKLIELARGIADSTDLRIYSSISNLLGWRTAARMAEALERIRE
jgi:glycosyltransferase involved in cell wall biosynthesis